MQTAYIALQTVYAVCCALLLVLSAVQYVSEYFLEPDRREVLVPVLPRLLHRVSCVAAVLQCVHAIDPYGELEILNRGGANQWLGANVTGLLALGAAAYILAILDSVYRVLQDRHPPWLMTFVIRASVVVVWVSGNLVTMAAVVADRGWITGINLLIISPTYLCVFIILVTSSIHLRRLLLSISQVDAKVEKAVATVQRTQIVGGALLLVSGVLGLYLGVERLHNRDQTLDRMLGPARSDSLEVSPFDWVMIGGNALFVWYAWQPVYACMTERERMIATRLSAPLNASAHDSADSAGGGGNSTRTSAHTPRSAMATKFSTASGASRASSGAASRHTHQPLREHLHMAGAPPERGFSPASPAHSAQSQLPPRALKPVSLPREPTIDRIEHMDVEIGVGGQSVGDEQL